MSPKTGKPSWTKPAPRPAGAGPVPGGVLRAAIALLVAAAVGLFIGVQVAGPSTTDTAIASLRADEAKRDAYAALKKDLAARFPFDRPSYLNGKAEFILATIAAHPSRSS
jgi:hypothetical protein